ncbi:uncharacterized protein LOC135393809 [Ornithodoros turicata]|uniref:uncharacterized protein LOC135393809 n=1 Tax=Ornithodoros turicata TaxID=34597 RepID=UPI003139D4E7
MSAECYDTKPQRKRRNVNVTGIIVVSRREHEWIIIRLQDKAMPRQHVLLLPLPQQHFEEAVTVPFDGERDRQRQTRRQHFQSNPRLHSVTETTHERRRRGLAEERQRDFSQLIPD